MMTDPTLAFTWALLRANLRDVRAIIVNLLAPVAIVVMFIATGNREGMIFIFPLVLSFSVLFGGSALMVRMIAWRQGRVFRRLAVTPVPLPNLILGLILAQLVVNIMQVQVLLALGVMFGLEITLPQLLIVEGAVVLGSLAFTAFGAALSTVVHRVDVASTAYVLIMMPLAFTGLLPDLSGVVRLLPSTMFTDLVRIIDGPLDVPTVLIGVGGLLAYTALFLWFAGWRFRWD